MIAYRCFLCSARIGRKHVTHATYMDGRRHEVRLCYGCGMPEGDDAMAIRSYVQSCKAVDAKLNEIKTLEV